MKCMSKKSNVFFSKSNSSTPRITQDWWVWWHWGITNNPYSRPLLKANGLTQPPYSRGLLKAPGVCF